MIAPRKYPIPVANYSFVNNLWGTASEGDLRYKGSSHLTTPIVRPTRILRRLPVTEAWGQGPRRQLKALFYHPSDHTLPKQPQKTDPLGQHPQESAYTRAYHLQNFHDKGYETSSVPTNNDPFENDKYHRKQHFVRGMIPGGSVNNKMIYGTDELLTQSEEKKLAQATSKSLGFIYGSENATNVGKQKPSTRPNNALWLEQRVFDDYASQNKKLASDQDNFLKRHQNEKQKQIWERENEKKQDMEMLRSFEPWGKPGAGAPNKGTGPNKARRTKAVTTLKEEEYNPLGGRGEGGGAPNRTVSGRPLTLLRGDPELRFPNYSKTADVVPGLRYKKDTEIQKRYGKDLENFMDEVKVRKQLQRQKSFEQELHHNSQNPFGKQGGGAPLKNEKGELKSAYQTTLSQDMCELRTVEPRHPHAYSNTQNYNEYDKPKMSRTERYDPWGKGYGAAEREKGGKIVKAAKPRNDETDGIGIPVGRPGAGAPIMDNDGNIKTKKAQTLTKDNYGQAMSRDFSPKGSRDLYNPFGRPGGGAPIRNSDGKVRTHLVAKVEQDGMESPTTSKNDLLAKQTYLKKLQDMKYETERQRRAESEDLKKSGPDVASWLRSGMVGQPKFDPVTKEIIAAHKQTSDVTQQKLNIRRMKNESSSNYHHDLQTLAEERQQQRNKEREIEKQTSMQHVDTMNHLWGRPGAGAPLCQGDVTNARKQRVGLAPADELKFRLL